MADESYTFAQARTRLEDIVMQVRKKDTSLEKSLDLLEEGVRLANVCTEQSDHTEWRTVVDEQQAEEVDSDVTDSSEKGEVSETADSDEDAVQASGIEDAVDSEDVADGDGDGEEAPSSEDVADTSDA